MHVCACVCAFVCDNHICLIELYQELLPLDTQLARLEAALRVRQIVLSGLNTDHFSLQGGQLIRAPSMTLSESQAMDTFEFLGSEDNILAHRFSRTSMDFSEGKNTRAPVH